MRLSRILISFFLGLGLAACSSNSGSTTTTTSTSTTSAVTCYATGTIVSGQLIANSTIGLDVAVTITDTNASSSYSLSVSGVTSGTSTGTSSVASYTFSNLEVTVPSGGVLSNTVSVTDSTGAVGTCTVTTSGTTTTTGGITVIGGTTGTPIAGSFAITANPSNSVYAGTDVTLFASDASLNSPTYYFFYAYNNQWVSLTEIENGEVELVSNYSGSVTVLIVAVDSVTQQEYYTEMPVTFY